ncbi:hypothetical protein HG537_0B01250 [Torulaspora globosa]|uniref:Restriction of telomere capping protein 4 n=1 Tax=Torulaspora globosa TaxID=48254 RepID=A0A7H9HNE2_9SACH|nr:hypothetical protein HG537_0B01250 [Torulaspora sp. CBS 2947]
MTARKALKCRRNLVYSTREDRDKKLEVIKRRRARILRDEQVSNVASGRPGRCAKLRALKAIAAGESSDSSDTDRETVDLRQSIAPEDIEEIKKQNSKGLRSVKDLIEMEERSIECQPLRSFDEQELPDLRLKYQQKFSLPPILYRSELIIRIQPFLQVIEELFQNRVSSYYKHEASNASKASKNAFLSLEEFRSIDVRRFLAGYYGLKRQLSVGEEILRQFRPFLLKRQGKTMKWWGIEDFANYVLAPEVLASFCIQEMQLGDNIYDRDTREKAYDIFQNTTEFGLAIADAEPLEQWEASSLTNQRQDQT